MTTIREPVVEINTYETLQLPKLKISTTDVNKIHALGLSDQDNKLLLFIYYYLHLSGLFQGQNILLISIDIFANIKHPKSNIDIDTFMIQINKYFRQCDTQSTPVAETSVAETSVTETSVAEITDPLQMNVKSVLQDNIVVLQKMKEMVEFLLKNTSIKLSQFKDIITKILKTTPIPDLTNKSISFTLHISQKIYSLEDTSTPNDTIIQLSAIYTDLLDNIDKNITLLTSLLKLEYPSLLTQLQTYKRENVRPIQFFIDKHIHNMSEMGPAGVNTQYISKLLALLLHNFVFDIPIYSYHNIYEKQIHLQKRLQNILINIGHVYNVSPFTITLDVQFEIIQASYSLDIHFDDILQVLQCKRPHSSFTLNELFKQIVLSELQHYVHSIQNTTKKIVLREVLQNLLFEAAIYIYDTLIPTFNSFTQAGNLLMDTTPPVETISSLQSTMNIHVCKGKSLPELTELIKLIFSPKEQIVDAIEYLFKSKKDNIEDTIFDTLSESNIILFSIRSVTEINFILLLDIFLGLCSKGSIQAFGRLSQTFDFNTVSAVKEIKTSETNNSFSEDDLKRSIYTTYYLDATCKDALLQYLTNPRFNISTDMIAIQIAI